MTAAPDVTEHPFVSPPEPGLTPAQIIARAQAIAPSLVERQAETERRAGYAPDVHQEFAKAGFYRILVPRRYGGYEFGVATFLRVTMALARGCPSTGWMYCLGATHALPVATLFGEQAQAALFRDGDFICPATIVPSGTAERGAEGGWRLSGTWRYCSGSPYGTHFMGHTMVSPEKDAPPRPMLFVAPRSEWRTLDDWGDQLGLKGSGSNSVTIDGTIPDIFTLPGVHLGDVTVTEGTPGRELHGNPEYGGGQRSFMLLEIAALAVGIAQGALDASEDLMRSRKTLLPPTVSRSLDPDYQRWYGEAAGMIATAEAALLDAVRQWSDTAAEGPAAVTKESDIRLTLICRQVIKLCWQAVADHLFPTAGSSSVRQGERVERVWRDLSTLHSHSGVAVFLPTIVTREYSRIRFGVTDPPVDGQTSW